jgi:hypothetical protein
MFIIYYVRILCHWFKPNLAPRNADQKILYRCFNYSKHWYKNFISKIILRSISVQNCATCSILSPILSTCTCLIDLTFTYKQYLEKAAKKVGLHVAIWKSGIQIYFELVWLSVTGKNRTTPSIDFRQPMHVNPLINSGAEAMICGNKCKK